LRHWSNFHGDVSIALLQEPRVGQNFCGNYRKKIAAKVD